MVTVTIYRLDGSPMDLEFLSARWNAAGTVLICRPAGGEPIVEFPIHRIAEVGRSA